MELLQHTKSEKQTPGEKKERMQRSKFLNALASHCRSFAWPSGESILFSLQDVCDFRVGLFGKLNICFFTLGVFNCKLEGFDVNRSWY